MTKQYPVALKIVATVTDPESGEVVDTIEVDMTRAAPMQAVGIELDRRGYDPLVRNAETRSWVTTPRGAQRV